jgi:cytochrome bd ubiquinol oxidase subunit I
MYVHSHDFYNDMAGGKRSVPAIGGLMGWQAVTLARAQFALTIMFHYLFPPLSIGLGTLLVAMEWRYLRSHDPVWECMARFFTRIFAVNFALGVATGVVMEFEFGTNWAVYSRFVGDVFGSALAAEGIFAFFLESGFLAVLVFGWDRVSPRVHFLATTMVALGAVFSSVWIVVANSWQQTPAGFHIVGRGAEARAEITDFWAMVLNPSSVDRLVHVLIAACILGAFFVMSISAYYLLRVRHVEMSRRAFSLALSFALVSSLAALASGHVQAHTVSHTQPAKLAAFEGHFRTGEGGAPLYLFGWPDTSHKIVRLGLAIPDGLSLLVHGDPHVPVTGLDAFPARDQPPVLVPFLAYHIMVGLGIAFIILTVFAAVLRRRGTLFETRWLLRIFVLAVAGPYAANELGWVAAEVGRQPWVVYGLLRTADAASRTVSANAILTSIVMFAVIYALLLAVFIVVLNDKIQHGPDEPAAPHGATTAGELLDAAAALVTPGDHSLTAAGPRRRP